MWRTACLTDPQVPESVLPGIFHDLHLTRTQQGTGERGSQAVNWYPDILDRDTLTHVAAKLGTTDQDITRRLLWNQLPDVAPLDPDNPPDPLQARDYLLSRWWGRHQTRVCVECLDEQDEPERATLTVWQSAWTFACVRHDRLLSHHCSECRKPYQIVPTFPTKVNHPGACLSYAQADPTNLNGAPEIVDTQQAINDARDTALAQRNSTGDPVPFYDRLARAFEAVRSRRQRSDGDVVSRLRSRAANVGLPADIVSIPINESRFPPARTLAVLAPEVWESYLRQ